MVWVAIYLYLMGSIALSVFIKNRTEKTWLVLLWAVCWPILVPIVAAWKFGEGFAEGVNGER